MGLRFHLPKDSGWISPAATARFMGLSQQTFDALLPEYLEDGFPPSDPRSGNFFLPAVVLWSRSRNPKQFPQSPQLTLAPAARDASDVVLQRLAGKRG